jgi:hypothetical protein
MEFKGIMDIQLQMGSRRLPYVTMWYLAVPFQPTPWSQARRIDMGEAKKNMRSLTWGRDGYDQQRRPAR